MVTQYGMSDELGLGTFERTRSGLLLGGPSAATTTSDTITPAKRKDGLIDKLATPAN